VPRFPEAVLVPIQNSLTMVVSFCGCVGVEQELNIVAKARKKTVRPAINTDFTRALIILAVLMARLNQMATTCADSKMFAGICAPQRSLK
jgi:hypothetical protein